MGQAGGLVVKLTPGRYRQLESYLSEYDFFAEPVPDFGHSRTRPLVCFLVVQGSLRAIARGRKGVRAGTGLTRLNLTDVVYLSPPLSTDDLVSVVPTKLWRGIQSRFESGGLLTEKGFNAVVDGLVQMRPDLQESLRQFSLQRRTLIARLSPETRNALAYQKEAVATALALAGIERTVLQEWTPPADAKPDSFLSGLPAARLREDPMVVQDLGQVPGFDKIGDLPFNAAVFEKDRVRLTVVLANRQPLEQLLGTDLIYVNETYKSVVMVQYKAMDLDRDKNALFRLPNAQLDEEIRRMNAVQEEIDKCSQDNSIEGFRLSERPFYLKLCPRLVFNPDDMGLVKGMYLPLDYWSRLVLDPRIAGKRGGLAVTYRNSGRYLDNTEFITLVTKAWIGTTIQQSAVLMEAIRDTIESGRAVALAVKSERPRDPDDDAEEYDPLDLTGTEIDEDDIEQLYNRRS